MTQESPPPDRKANSPDRVPRPSSSRRAPKRILLLGATGTIGTATARELRARGEDVVRLIRQRRGEDIGGDGIRFGEAGDPATLSRILDSGRFDAVISCLASRTGVREDAWAVDYRANANAIEAAKAAGVPQMILVSALCVQCPRLAFQHAKLAAEAALAGSGLKYSIVRPTAFFKSLSGQFERVRAGKPYLLFGDGRLTATKPIGDEDLAAFIADCLDDPARANRILPVGGPGPAITPREQGEFLFRLLDRPVRFRQIPPGLLKAIGGGLDLAARFDRRWAARAELARIGHYYATRSMLVVDPGTGRYDEAITPSSGTQTLLGHYERLLNGEASSERGTHAVF